MAEADEEEVGYRKPPRSGQFRKGRSGNPSGRPKGRRSLSTILMKALFETVTATQSGRRRKMSKIELGFKQLATKAASGDRDAVKDLIDILQRLRTDPSETKREPVNFIICND